MNISDATGGCPMGSLLDLDNFSSGTPHAAIKALRSSGERLIWQKDDHANGGHWLVLQRDDIDTVLGSPERFTSNFSQLLEDLPEDLLALQQDSLAFLDPPRHRQFRVLVDGAFKPKALAAREPWIRATAAEIVDQIVDRGHCEFVHDVAAQTPMRIILGLLGVEEKQYAKMAELVNTITLANDPDYAVDREAGFAASAEAFALGMQLAQQHRQQARDTLTQQLLETNIDGQQLSDEQYGGFFVNLIIGGMETTRNMSSWLLYELLQHPEQLEALRSDLSLLPAAIEEILRYRNTAVYMRRTATEDMQFADKAVKKGDKLVCVLGAANRDERYFDEPDRFDIFRDRLHTRRNIRTFGGGPHFCIGLHQARLIMQALFEQLFSKLDNFEMIAEPTHFRSNFMDGFKRFDIRFSKR